MHPDPINNGFRPERVYNEQRCYIAEQLHRTDYHSGQISVNWTAYLIIKIGKNGALQLTSSFSIPEARKMSTVKNITASIPLNCCISDRVRPTPNGFKIDRLSKTSSEWGFTVFWLDFLEIVLYYIYKMFPRCCLLRISRNLLFYIRDLSLQLQPFNSTRSFYVLFSDTKPCWRFRKQYYRKSYEHCQRTYDFIVKLESYMSFRLRANPQLMYANVM